MGRGAPETVRKIIVVLFVTFYGKRSLKDFAKLVDNWLLPFSVPSGRKGVAGSGWAPLRGVVHEVPAERGLLLDRQARGGRGARLHGVLIRLPDLDRLHLCRLCWCFEFQYISSVLVVSGIWGRPGAASRAERVLLLDRAAWRWRREVLLRRPDRDRLRPQRTGVVDGWGKVPQVRWHSVE